MTDDGDGDRVPCEGEVTIGRTAGDIRFPDDPFLSARHARVRRTSGQIILEDLASTNGTFVRINQEMELRPGDIVRIGSQLFRFLA